MNSIRDILRIILKELPKDPAAWRDPSAHHLAEQARERDRMREEQERASRQEAGKKDADPS